MGPVGITGRAGWAGGVGWSDWFRGCGREVGGGKLFRGGWKGRVGGNGGNDFYGTGPRWVGVGGGRVKEGVERVPGV